MIFLFLTVVSLGLFVYSLRKNFDEVFVGICIIFSITFFVITTLIVTTGIIVYPELRGKYEKVISLKEEITSVKNAYYESSGKGLIVGGSLDNLGQSKALSEYIEEYAKVKAEYNEELTYYRTIKKMFFYRIFGNSCFISDKIFELERVK